jgi:hypothetical protein
VLRELGLPEGGPHDIVSPPETESV